MRLINTNTLQLSVFTKHPPAYAILSHRWYEDPEEEATLQRFQQHVQSSMDKPEPQPQRRVGRVHRILHGRRTVMVAPSSGGTATVAPSSGIEKVLAACRTAVTNNLMWLWVDTVCIDRTNNVELSEAINSMYTWYHASALCLVYLRDIDSARKPEELVSSVWFGRGWTLQELLAPTNMCFYRSDWSLIGNKYELASQLSSSTGIPSDVLKRPSRVFVCSVACRMSWAACRSTSRDEDLAYCLMGLFKINMELLYGEGAESAFKRLQMRILQESEDESIFSWRARQDEWRRPGQFSRPLTPDSNRVEVLSCGFTGLLATRPQQFLGRGNVVLSYDFVPDTPIRLTNRGLDMMRQVAPLEGSRLSGHGLNIDSTHWPWRTSAAHIIAVPISCNEDTSAVHTCILLAQDPYSLPVHRWCRLHVEERLDTELKSLATRNGYDTLMNPLYVRISWPSASKSVSSHLAVSESLKGSRWLKDRSTNQ